jgi:AraC-like DNA-binding protein
VRLPDAWTSIVLRGHDDGPPGLVVLGPRRRASYHTDRGLGVRAKIRLRPGVAEGVLGLPVRELAQRAVPLDLVWGDDAGITATLCRLAADPKAVRSELRRRLLLRLQDAPDGVRRRARLAAAAASALSGAGCRDGLRPTVSEVARSLSVSERQLRSVFSSVVGLSPKRFASVERVRAVTAADANCGLAEVATSVGYYDQAHLTADFRAAMGVTPGGFRAGRFPPPTACGS